ncbi:hypothetical protein FACS1894219_10660 [Clostridia bacterium]|nr:hypothetical protein FACS1894219_10660 [Clostridia bacterium]
MNESQLVYEIMREVGKYGYIVRCNAGQIKLNNGKVFRGMPRGFSDLLFIRNGKATCLARRIEVKYGKGKRLARHNTGAGAVFRAYAGLCLARQCAAGVVRSVDETMKLCGL